MAVHIVGQRESRMVIPDVEVGAATLRIGVQRLQFRRVPGGRDIGQNPLTERQQILIGCD
jgi:hypothetical protein